jgi:hypothetical protein
LGFGAGAGASEDEDEDRSTGLGLLLPLLAGLGCCFAGFAFAFVARVGGDFGAVATADQDMRPGAAAGLQYVEMNR